MELLAVSYILSDGRQSSLSLMDVDKFLSQNNQKSDVEWAESDESDAKRLMADITKKKRPKFFEYEKFGNDELEKEFSKLPGITKPYFKPQNLFRNPSKEGRVIEILSLCFAMQLFLERMLVINLEKDEECFEFLTEEEKKNLQNLITVFIILYSTNM